MDEAYYLSPLIAVLVIFSVLIIYSYYPVVRRRPMPDVWTLLLSLRILRP